MAIQVGLACNCRTPATAAARPGGVDDTDWSAAMNHPTEPEPAVQTADTTDTEPAGPAPCCCGSIDHEALRIGDQLSPTGSAVRAVYVCPGISATGLRGAL